MATVKFNRKIKSQIFSLAWELIKNNNIGMSEALKRAWSFLRSRISARMETVKVTFLKKDGSVREAEITTSFDFIPVEHQPKNSYPYQLGHLRAFDVQKQGWIQFGASNIIV